MAGALLNRALAEVGLGAEVVTAGLLESGQPAAVGVEAALARHGVNLSRHASRKLAVEMIRDADVVIGMERAHVREVVLLEPRAWSRTFALKELVRRGERTGPRRADETAAEWFEAVHHGRRRADLLGDDGRDDLADPMGRPQRAFDRTAAELADLTSRFAGLLRGSTGPVPIHARVPESTLTGW
jgi:protein-tyrosine phosphatase